MIEFEVVDSLEGISPGLFLKIDRFTEDGAKRLAVPGALSRQMLRLAAYHYRSGPKDPPRAFSQTSIRGFVYVQAQHIDSDSEWSAFQEEAMAAPVSFVDDSPAGSWTATALPAGSSLQVIRSRTINSRYTVLVDQQPFSPSIFTVGGSDLTKTLPFFTGQ
jgi:hypothetical protein